MTTTVPRPDGSRVDGHLDHEHLAARTTSSETRPYPPPSHMQTDQTSSPEGSGAALLTIGGLLGRMEQTV